ncbi:MAG: class I fructose-bisphosphate aldolase [Desulfurococcaceae archaeon TW002]
MSYVRPTSNYVGKYVRLSRIMPDGKSVIFAFDHGVEHGPKDFTEESIDPRSILSKVVEGGVDAVLLLHGIAKMTYDVWGNKAALILKITGKTMLRPEEHRYLQSVFGSVEDAISMGAEAVAATVYWGSQYEDIMLRNWFVIREAAEKYGMPCLQLAYPRNPQMKNIYDVEIVRYGARAASESGADIIKTYYTGSRETFAEVVKAAAGVPVLMSGGPKTQDVREFLAQVENVMSAGGRGVVVGRNVFQHKNPGGVIRALKEIVHEGKSLEDVLYYVK